MKYPLIISDYDGTMAMRGEVSESISNAINEYEKKGGKFVICTGRTPSSIKQRVENYRLPKLIGAHQGSLIIDLETDKIIKNGGLDYQTACEIVDVVKCEAPVSAYVIDEIFYDISSRYVDVFKQFCKTTKVDDLAKELRKKKPIVNRLVLSTTPDKVSGLIDKYSKIFKGKAIVNSGANYIVEFVSPSFSKKQAVEFLAEHYGVPLDKVMTVGDSTNDIPLLDGEWHGVAVGSACPELKKVAKEITVPFEEEPIKYLIEKYCLTE